VVDDVKLTVLFTKEVDVPRERDTVNVKSRFFLYSDGLQLEWLEILEILEPAVEVVLEHLHALRMTCDLRPKFTQIIVTELLRRLSLGIKLRDQLMDKRTVV
jgi:hypothetical protein